MGGRGASYGIAITDKQGETRKFYAVPGNKNAVMTQDYNEVEYKGGLKALSARNKTMGNKVDNVSEAKEAKENAARAAARRLPDRPPAGSGHMARQSRLQRHDRPPGAR